MCGGCCTILAFIIILAIFAGHMITQMRGEGHQQSQIAYPISYSETKEIALDGDMGIYLIANDLKQANNPYSLGANIDLLAWKKYITVEFIVKRGKTEELVFEGEECTKDHFNFTSETQNGAGEAIKIF